MSISDVTCVYSENGWYLIDIVDFGDILRAANNGNSTAQYQLGELCYHSHLKVVGYHHENSNARFGRSMAEVEGDWLRMLAYGSRADEDGYTEECIRNLPEALLWYRMSAAQGNANAQRMVEEMGRNGIKVNQDDLRTLNMLAEADDSAAQCRLGIYYYKKHRYGDAFKFLSKAAEHGEDEAQFFLAIMYYEGKGVEQNYAEAFKWSSKAAGQGNVMAQSLLGGLYYEGIGVSQNYVEAFKWFSKAAKQGNAFAQNGLGVMYDNGEGVEQNYAEALKWYLKAVEQGDATAQYNLGDLYYKGTGVKRNCIEALKWYRKAAEQGDEDAQKAIRQVKHPKNWFNIICNWCR